MGDTYYFINPANFVRVEPVQCPLCKQDREPGEQHMTFFDTGSGLPSWGCRLKRFVSDPAHLAIITDIG
jgi:hypothetical protein